MNKALSDFLKKFNKLCIFCENWTKNTCHRCSEYICEACCDDHLDDHAIEDAELEEDRD